MSKSISCWNSLKEFFKVALFHKCLVGLTNEDILGLNYYFIVVYVVGIFKLPINKSVFF